MATPLPGRRVRGSRTGRPIMALLDLLGRRWVLRILYELRDGPLKFRVLQERCEGMSPSVLSQRLKELVEAGVLVAEAGGAYGFTAAGDRLRKLLGPLVAWSEEWARGK
jgi:DNA-binding HxlR family transcriptional regulator